MQIIVEDEDGEVVKKYELPSHKADNEGGDLMAQSLKYMGIGSLVKGSSGKTTEAGPSGSSGAAVNSAVKASGMPQRSKKKSEAAEGDIEDDKHIRFKIGGVGQRMTEDDFIREMQKLDKSTQREVVDQSSASGPVKALAKQDTRPSGQPEPALPREADREEERGRSRADPTPATRQPEADLAIPRADRSDEEETTAERRRRMAVLESVHRDHDVEEAGETPAERRRREAALGIRAQAETAESESDDDDTPRIPPGRRGIRFADAIGRQGA